MKKRVFLFLAAAAVLLAVACNKAGLERTTLNTAEDYYARGHEYLNNGDYDKAIADFTLAISLDPYDFRKLNDDDFYFIRLDAYLKRHGIDNAIANYTQAIRLDPNDVYAYHWLDDCHFLESLTLYKILS